MLVLQALRQDLIYAWRSLSGAPQFTVAALLSLAISIGANTAVFSVANALLLRPLGYPDADRLVILWNRSPGLGILQDWFSTAQYYDIKTSQEDFEQLGLAIGATFNLTGEGNEAERIGAIRVSSNLLPMLGARVVAGQLFSAESDVVGHPSTVLLSHGLWTRRYGGDPKIVGQSIRLNGQPLQVAGVLAPGFALPREVMPVLYGGDRADVFLSLPLPTGAEQLRTHEDYDIIGRLRSGASTTRVQAAMDALTARLRHEHPDNYPANGKLTFGVVPLLDQAIGEVRPSLLLTLGAVGFVLLVACANVANLLLARAVRRQGEIAVRLALGASRRRIVSQLLTESILLAVCGGALGFLLATWSCGWIRLYGGRSLPRLAEINADWRVFAFMMGISLIAGVLFGLVPAWKLSRLEMNSTLKQEGRGGSGLGVFWGRGHNTRRLLVVGELALSVTLLIGAGLLIRSFARLQEVPPGFRPNSVLTFDLELKGARYKDGTAVLNGYRELWERLRAMPGVDYVGATTSLPFSAAFAWTPITVEGYTLAPGEKFLNSDVRVVAGQYFETMGIPLREGRLFNEQDNSANPRVIVVDEHMARQLWPGQSAIGKRIHMVETNIPWMTVVGVVGRIKQDALDADSRIALYMPHLQSPSRLLSVVLKSHRELSSEVKQQVRLMDPDLAVYGMRPMNDRVAESLAPRRFFALVLGVFAMVALVLSAIGIYGVIAYMVDQGRHDIGIRMAVGATQSSVVRMVVKQGLFLSGVGTLIGLAGALVLSGLMQGLLYGVGRLDAPTFVIVPAVLGLVALAATYIPARRAARFDALSLLRR